MKLIPKHEKIIGHSLILEALSLSRALAFPDFHGQVLPLEAFDQLAHKHEALLAFLRTHEQFSLSILELALIVLEREDVGNFFDEARRLPKVDQIFHYFGCDVDREFLLQADQDPDLLVAHIHKGSQEDKRAAAEKIMEWESLLGAYQAFAEDASSHPAFIQGLTAHREDIDREIETMVVGMDHRHPLSYAQEVMGKNFWNIADWQVYEFAALYWISPVTVRYMNQDRQLFIKPSHRIQKDRDALKREVAGKLKLISDPKRLEILHMTYMKPMYGKQIADALGLTTATVSHHLDALHKAGLLHLEKERHIKYFSTNNRGLQVLLKQLNDHIRGNE